jgi:long-subunit acyl-CoA synthetase (AMP-forming)
MLLGRAFALEHGEVTPKLSLCRTVIQQRFTGEIEKMYRQTIPSNSEPRRGDVV